MTSPARPAVVVTRELPASPERVFDWLTDPDKLARWMSPVGEVLADADCRPGGRLRIVMFDGNTRIEHTGEFVEISRPRRLVFTWISQYTEGDSVVSIELEPHGDRTILTLSHERLPDRSAAEHASGWGLMLDRLVQALQRTEPKRGVTG